MPVKKTTAIIRILSGDGRESDFAGWGYGRCLLSVLQTGWETGVIVLTLARKPLIGSVAANVLKHGPGGLNING